jgi:two-component system, cell cycle response regulator
MRILVADDEATTRLVLKALVTKLGHQCLIAEDGLGAWELLTSEPIDVLLTDWMMPGLDGLQLCRRVREELSGRPGRYTYIVLITGLGQREQVLTGMSAGADDYLVKPVVPFDVQTRLIAAERVTALHHQVTDYRNQLELANQELLALSLTDALTGLGNRRRMDEDLIRVHAQALRIGRPFSLALFDIDHFKLYNEHYGHIGGDDALRRVAECLGQVLRRGESVYRYGGEEFLLLLPDCDIDAAAVVVERLRGAIEEMATPHLARPTLPAVVTLSGAVACWTPNLGLSMPELLAQVDEALYEAKSTGRNRIHVALADHAVNPNARRRLHGTKVEGTVIPSRR